MLRSSEVTAVWPNDDDFKRGWLTKPVYVKSRSDRTAMVLRAIERQMRNPKNEANALPDELSVEHLLPQRGTVADYPYASDLPLQAGETTEACRARLCHTMGNLTLLTQALNTAISNGPFNEKTAAIVQDSDLRLNAWLRTRPNAPWNEDDIQTRGGTLFAHASAIWGRPAHLHPKASAEKGGARKHFTDRIAALIAAGLLHDGEPLTLVYKRKTFAGQLTVNGIKVRDGVYAPSEAAKQCYASTGSTRASENGWMVWKTATGQSLRDLLYSIGESVDGDERSSITA
ncbi:DUF1524 domain-containing protein [Hyphomicrobium sp.]|uniref:GmrSD restriction endonuclease domain-containing protein n=1 Tax=Hyphomicrobium sp. TaxID=82 RepID=UPI0025C0B54D|nr:DUF1524 domain-containing protein [Hyphomicrobium sp.]